MKIIQSNFSAGPAFSDAFVEVLGEVDRYDCKGQIAIDIDVDHLQELCNCLAAHFNQNCACGLAQQIGRSAFSHLLRGKNGQTGLTDQSFRLMSGRLRLMRGFDKLEALIEDIFKIPVNMVDAADAIQIKTHETSVQHDLIPYLEAGFIQEFVQWVSGGKPHAVKVKARAVWLVGRGRQGTAGFITGTYPPSALLILLLLILFITPSLLVKIVIRHQAFVCAVHQIR